MLFWRAEINDGNVAVVGSSVENYETRLYCCQGLDSIKFNRIDWSINAVLGGIGLWRRNFARRETALAKCHPNKNKDYNGPEATAAQFFWRHNRR